jgi:purine-binding chemotaxis protein CheW
MAGGTEGSRLDVLIFQLEGRRFGLPVKAVEELVRAVAQTPLDGVKSRFEGIINLRGSLVPVLDLRPSLGMTPRPVQTSDQLIIARSALRRVAVRVDFALELTQLVISREEETRSVGGPDLLIEGMAKHDRYGVVPVLLLDALLGDGTPPSQLINIDSLCAGTEVYS